MVKKVNKSLLKTSSLKMNLGETIEAILVQAQEENRLIGGLSNVSKHLKETECSEHSLFFFVAPSPPGNAVNHMQEVVLQSFCFEHDIYIIKLDSAEKLTNILRCDHFISCALVQRMTTATRVLGIATRYTDLETTLIDHCEYFWDEIVQPVIKLPEK